MTLLITGAAGTIGAALATDLAARGIPLRLLDRSPIVDPPLAAEVIRTDLRDQNAVEEAVANTSAVIHLAGLTHEGPFAEMIENNIIATHNILESARHRQVPRVVLASSHHVVGMNPIGCPALLAPDSFYAVSKATIETLGYLYAHKSDVQVVVVRIGSYRTRPTEPRHRATWLSPRDAISLLYAAATRPLPDSQFLAVYGISDNAESWWPKAGWDVLGYCPADNADNHHNGEAIADTFMGGTFATGKLPERLIPR